MSSENQVDYDIEKPHLSTEYYKARKSYNLFSGLLLVWGIVGININSMPAPNPSNITNLNVQFKTPGAIPYVLIFMVIFYAYRLTIEWYQSSCARRVMWQSKADFFSSHLFAFISFSIFVLQNLVDRQVYDIFVENNDYVYLGSLMFICLLYSVFFVYIIKGKNGGSINKKIFVNLFISYKSCDKLFKHENKYLNLFNPLNFLHFCFSDMSYATRVMLSFAYPVIVGLYFILSRKVNLYLGLILIILVLLFQIVVYRFHRHRLKYRKNTGKIILVSKR